MTLFSRRAARTAHAPRSRSGERDNAYEEIVIGKRRHGKRSLRAVTNAGTVPQVFIGGKLIGSADDLDAYFKKLDTAAA